MAGFLNLLLPAARVRFPGASSCLPGKAGAFQSKGDAMGAFKESAINLKKAMEITGYSRSNMYRLVSLKLIPHYRPTGGKIFFLESEIQEFLLRNRVAANYEVSEKADAILNRETK